MSGTTRERRHTEIDVAEAAAADFTADAVLIPHAEILVVVTVSCIESIKPGGYGRV